MGESQLTKTSREYLLFTKSLVKAQIEGVDLVEMFSLVLSCMALGHLVDLMSLEIHRFQWYVVASGGLGQLRLMSGEEAACS